MDESSLLHEYRAMSLDEIKALWDDGNYPGPIEHYNAIAAAYRARTQVRVAPTKACAHCLLVACVCGKSTLF